MKTNVFERHAQATIQNLLNAGIDINPILNEYSKLPKSRNNEFEIAVKIINKAMPILFPHNEFTTKDTTNIVCWGISMQRYQNGGEVWDFASEFLLEAKTSSDVSSTIRLFRGKDTITLVKMINSMVSQFDLLESDNNVDISKITKGIGTILMVLGAGLFNNDDDDKPLYETISKVVDGLNHKEQAILLEKVETLIRGITSIK